MRFNIDLRDYDLESYKENPIVLWNFSHTELPAGKVTEIAPDLQSVEVELNPYLNEDLLKLINPDSFRLAPAVINRLETDSITEELLDLSIVVNTGDNKRQN